MNTASCKAKGRRLASFVRDTLLSWAKDLSGGDIWITPASMTGEDLILSPKAKEIYNFAIECKNQESLNIWAALKQSREHVKGDEVPIVCFTRNREGRVYVALELEKFMSLIR